MRNILIVGGAGYVGSVLTEHLLRAGHEVRCLDLLLYGNQGCILPYMGHPHYTFVCGDMCDAVVLKKAAQGATDVILLAGLVGDPITKQYPAASQAINEVGVQSCLRFFAGQGIHRLIFVSTCSNYGLIANNELATEEHELKPLSLYAKAKVVAEKYILAKQGHWDFVPTILRFATAFGLSPRMRFDLLVNEFTRELALGRELLVFDAHTWRPYCHVRDFARLVSMVLDAPVEKVAFEVFNAGGEVNNYTKEGILDVIRSQLSIRPHFPKANIKYEEHGPDPRNYRVDFGKVRRVLGFEPAYTVPDGVKELLDAIENRLFDHADSRREFHGNYHIDYGL
jgi:nucleoside-diphosphate-sugar epimerase